jgi:hypothetical protein
MLAHGSANWCAVNTDFMLCLVSDPTRLSITDPLCNGNVR